MPTLECVQPISTYALGLELRLTTTERGGQRTPLIGGADPGVRFTYRPNWGLPGMTPPEQTGAPVLGFSADLVLPGDSMRVVIVPPYEEKRSKWERVRTGDVLPMYEGARLCGHGTVLLVVETTWPLSHDDEQRLLSWLGAP